MLSRTDFAIRQPQIAARVLTHRRVRNLMLGLAQPH